MKRAFWLVVLPLLLLEAAFRLAPEPRIAGHWLYDPLLGHKGPPNAALATSPASELRLDSQGFRALPPAPPPTGLAVRVAVLGDSITEAATTPVEATFPALLQPLLRAEVRQFSSGDWGTVQELLAYRAYAHAWKPDLVLLEFSAINDFHNNSPEWAGRYQSRMDSVRPYWDGAKAYYLHPIRGWLRDHSAALRWVFARALSGAVTEVQTASPGCAADPNLAGVELYRTKRDEAATALIAETAAAFRALRVETSPTRMVAVFFPNPLELNPDLYAEVIDGQLRSCHPADPPPNRREAEKKFFEAAKSGGIEAWSLFDDFDKAMKAGQNLFLESGQLSNAGHALAARVLAHRLHSSP